MNTRCREVGPTCHLNIPWRLFTYPATRPLRVLPCLVHTAIRSPLSLSHRLAGLPSPRTEMARRQRLRHQSRTQARDALGHFSRNPASTVPCCLTSSSSPASHAAIGPRRLTPSSMSKYLAATSAPLSTQGQIHDKTPKSPKKKGGFKGSGPTASVTKVIYWIYCVKHIARLIQFNILGTSICFFFAGKGTSIC
jgi:hypothetical protein